MKRTQYTQLKEMGVTNEIISCIVEEDVFGGYEDYGFERYERYSFAA